MIVFTGYAEWSCHHVWISPAAWSEWCKQFRDNVENHLVPGDTIVVAADTIVIWDGTTWRQQSD